MLEYWQHYVSVFRKLIISGWIIVKRKDSCLYEWVYPNTTVPTKWRLKEAYEILSYADSSNTVFGSTRNHSTHFCVTLDPPRPI